MYMDLNAKPSRMSRTVITDIILPGQTNYHGTVFGGQLLQSVDKAATIAAMRHSRSAVVTASSEAQFILPVGLGEAIELTASVIWSHRTSMDIYVVGQVENLLNGIKKEAFTAHLTFVAVDEHGKPKQVPALLPETEEESRLYQLGEDRYAERKRKREANTQ
jgi:acyl-CoA hydrolase